MNGAFPALIDRAVCLGSPLDASHFTANNLNVGRNPKDTLRILDALQTDELCACNRPVGGETL